MRRRVLLLAVAVLVAVGTPAGAQTCGPWSRLGAEPPFGGASLNAVTYGDGIFVAVGDDGLIASSTDGVVWTRRESGDDEDLRGVTWNGARYIAVGLGGPILASDDATIWRPVGAPFDLPLVGVTWSGSRFIAVGDGATILSSGDGEVWEAAATGGGEWVLHAVACGGGVCVTGGSYLWSTHYEGTMLRSTDGLTWQPVAAESEFPLQAFDLMWTGERFVAVGSSVDMPMVGWSDIGESWEFGPTVTGGSPNYSAVATDGLEILVFGDAGTLLSSPDGAAWSERSTSLGWWVRDAAWGGGRWVAVGWRGQTATSEDGVAWTLAVPALLDSFTWRGAATKGPAVVAAGADQTTGAAFVYCSVNGDTWQREALTLGSTLWLLTSFRDGFLGVTTAGFATSAEGTTWTSVPVPGFLGASGVVCSPSRCVAVGSTIMTSEDAVTWSTTTLPQGYQPRDIAWDGKQFVVVGRWGVKETGALFMRSDDGGHWEASEQPGYPVMPTAIAAGGGTLAVIGGQRGHVFTGTNGFTWQDHYLAVDAEMRDVVWTGSYFAVLGRKSDGIASVVWVSRDGSTWSEIAVPGNHDLREITGSGPRLHLFGDQGTILSTSCSDSVGTRAPRRRLGTSP
jgi:hypothetical protein